MQDLVGVRISHYCLQRRIARGGMSEIYLAQDLETNREVAIKLVHMGDDTHCARFRREVKAISALQHDHILPALDYGEYGSWLYLVSPYIAEGTLHNLLADGPLSCERANSILHQLADALHFAHEQGILHRDIKPSNVLLKEQAYVYLADFGLVKGGGEECSLTQSGSLLGTPLYMAPELVDHPATTASDVYALGVLLYQMLTGRLPFQATTPVAVILKHMREKPVPPSAVNPALSPAIDQVLLRALAKDPRERFTTPCELALAYQRALDPPRQATQPLNKEKLVAVLASFSPPALPHKRISQPAAIWCAAFCSLLLLFGVSISVVLLHSPPQPAMLGASVVGQPTAASKPATSPTPASGRGRHTQGNDGSHPTPPLVQWQSSQSNRPVSLAENGKNAHGSTHGGHGKGKGHRHQK